MTTVPAHQIAADLLSAAGHIEEFGLAKEVFGRPGRPCCAAGAIHVAVTASPWVAWIPDRPLLDRREKAIDILSAQLGGRHVALWNDDPDTSKDDVLKALREAAEAVLPTNTGRAPHGSTETGLAYMEASARFDGHGAARTEGESS